MTVFAPTVTLGPGDAVDGHLFTNPNHIAGDRAVMCMLAADFDHHARMAGQTTEAFVRYLPTEERWHRRVVVPHPDQLAEYDTITVVGFFGRVRDVVEPIVAENIKRLGEQLVQGVLEAPGLLGYTTHLLVDERNYANLVLVTGPEVIDSWRLTKPHPSASEDWSPRYYEHVRIYRGVVRRDEMDCEGAVILTSVKYWDYRHDPVWHAERTLA